MLFTTVVHVCLRCGSEKIRKNGHADNGAQCAKSGDVLELDELWSFVGGKASQLWFWWWVALCRRTRQIVGWTLGDRSLQSACGLRATRSDFWEA